MKTLNVTIELDPVNDGAVFVENRFKKKEEGALIIGTNGEKRIVGASEAQRILDVLAEVGHGEYMGKTDYLMMFNGNKILKFGTGECFIGSALIMKYDGKGLGFLSGDEFDEASKEF